MEPHLGRAHWTQPWGVNPRYMTHSSRLFIRYFRRTFRTESNPGWLVHPKPIPLISRLFLDLIWPCNVNVNTFLVRLLRLVQLLTRVHNLLVQVVMCIRKLQFIEKFSCLCQWLYSYTHAGYSVFDIFCLTLKYTFFWFGTCK